ncbi:hypothetical protein ACWIGM_09970 [Bosea sp. NPDC055332]
MSTQPKTSDLIDAMTVALPSRRELYRELCQDDEGNRYTVVVYRRFAHLSLTDYALEDGTPVRFIDDCLFEIEPTGKPLTRCP